MSIGRSRGKTLFGVAFSKNRRTHVPIFHRHEREKNPEGVKPG